MANKDCPHCQGVKCKKLCKSNQETNSKAVLKFKEILSSSFDEIDLNQLKIVKKKIKKQLKVTEKKKHKKILKKQLKVVKKSIKSAK